MFEYDRETIINYIKERWISGCAKGHLNLGQILQEWSCMLCINISCLDLAAKEKSSLACQNQNSSHDLPMHFYGILEPRKI